MPALSNLIGNFMEQQIHDYQNKIYAVFRRRGVKVSMLKPYKLWAVFFTGNGHTF